MTLRGNELILLSSFPSTSTLIPKTMFKAVKHQPTLLEELTKTQTVGIKLRPRSVALDSSISLSLSLTLHPSLSLFFALPVAVPRICCRNGCSRSRAEQSASSEEHFSQIQKHCNLAVFRFTLPFFAGRILSLPLNLW